LEYAEQQQQQQQQQQLQVATSDNGGSVADFAAVTSPLQSAIGTTTGNNSGNNGGNLGIAPRASPEISEAEVSTNMCHRLNVHRTSSVSCNGSENVVVGNVQAEASTVIPHVRYACENASQDASYASKTNGVIEVR